MTRSIIKAAEWTLGPAEGNPYREIDTQGA